MARNAELLQFKNKAIIIINIKERTFIKKESTSGENFLGNLY